VYPNPEKVASTFAKELGEDNKVVLAYLNRQKKNFEAVYPVFIAVSLHRISHWMNGSFFIAIARLFKYVLISSMHQVNAKTVKNKKTIQILDRMATYNGSTPYKTPGMLNIISHLEFNEGPAMPV